MKKRVNRSNSFVSLVRLVQLVEKYPKNKLTQLAWFHVLWAHSLKKQRSQNSHVFRKYNCYFSLFHYPRETATHLTLTFRNAVSFVTAPQEFHDVLLQYVRGHYCFTSALTQKLFKSTPLTKEHSLTHSHNLVQLHSLV